MAGTRKGKKMVSDKDFVTAVTVDARSGGTMAGTAARLDMHYGSLVQRRGKIMAAIDAVNVVRKEKGETLLAQLPDYDRKGGAKAKDYAGLSDLIPAEVVPEVVPVVTE